jgi:hypothetical protein
MYGGPQISVITKDKREHRATIRGLLRRRGATPIGIGDVVVLSGREFESRGALTPGQAGVGVVAGIAQDEVFDVIGIMDSRSATKAMKEGLFPAWMLTGSDDGRATAVVEEDDGIYFDEDAPAVVEGSEEEGEDAKKKQAASKAEKEIKRALARSAKTASSRRDDDDLDIDNI